MSKVPSYIKQKSREAMKEHNAFLNQKMSILEDAFKESRNILRLTQEGVEKVKNFDIKELNDFHYAKNKTNGNFELYAKVVAKVLVRFVRLNILTTEEAEKLFKDNVIDNSRDIFTEPFNLEFSLILLNLIYDIKETYITYRKEYYNFGIKVNFILSSGKRNIILYGIRYKYIKVTSKVFSIVNKMKEQENYKLFNIINKYKDLKMK